MKITHTHTHNYCYFQMCMSLTMGYIHKIKTIFQKKIKKSEKIKENKRKISKIKKYFFHYENIVYDKLEKLLN